ncbi:MAG: hypothetical protein J0L57_14905 [Burkholderiales bacterium]|nr:hypothetical protein [Burkholderiales bacterium]
MPTVYVLEPDPAERSRLVQALAGVGAEQVLLDRREALFDRLPACAGDGLVCGAEIGGVSAAELVRELRRRGERLPVVVTGPITAFRTAVDVARLDAADFLERPVSARRLRGALQRMGCTIA